MDRAFASSTHPARLYTAYAYRDRKNDARTFVSHRSLVPAPSFASRARPRVALVRIARSRRAPPHLTVVLVQPRVHGVDDVRTNRGEEDFGQGARGAVAALDGDHGERGGHRARRERPIAHRALGLWRARRSRKPVPIWSHVTYAFSVRRAFYFTRRARDDAAVGRVAIDVRTRVRCLHFRLSYGSTSARRAPARAPRAAPRSRRANRRRGRRARPSAATSRARSRASLAASIDDGEGRPRRRSPRWRRGVATRALGSPRRVVAPRRASVSALASPRATAR